MPIYMDVHFVPGVKAINVAEAHRLDMAHQDEYHCKCMTYWVDEERGNVFCLLEAPDKDAVIDMHRKAHGLLPHKIIEVSGKVVQSFLGRIFDPEDAETTPEGLPLINDSSFRILLTINTKDPLLLRYQLGIEEFNGLLERLNYTVRKNFEICGGTEVEYEHLIGSFKSASSAVSCAISIVEQLETKDMEILNLKISINEGIPIENTNTLFGETIEQALNTYFISGSLPVVISSYVKERVAKDYFKQLQNFSILSQQKEILLRQLFTVLKEHYQKSDFDIDQFSNEMSMSKSGLYRRTVELVGLSPNQLLKEFRLSQAKNLLKEQRFSISQITFDSGFSSPSYFTKCFRKQYGLLPMQYVDLLN